MIKVRNMHIYRDFPLTLSTFKSAKFPGSQCLLHMQFWCCTSGSVLPHLASYPCSKKWPRLLPSRSVDSHLETAAIGVTREQ